jgi:hypothetical protein
MWGRAPFPSKKVIFAAHDEATQDQTRNYHAKPNAPDPSARVGSHGVVGQRLPSGPQRGIPESERLRKHGSSAGAGEEGQIRRDQEGHIDTVSAVQSSGVR